MAGDNLYSMVNSPTNSTTTQTFQTTGTAENVLLQLSVPSTRQFTLVEYGISFDGSPAAIKVQLRTTSAAATIVAGVITPFTNPNAPTSLSTVTTTTSGYSTSGTVTPTATVSKIFDTQILSTNTYVKQWPLNREPGLAASDFLQLCVKAAVAVNASCYVIWRE